MEERKFLATTDPPQDLPFCGACFDHHAMGATCVADLESAVIEAAIAWRRLDVEVREVGDHFELDPLRESVDALITAREK